LDYLISYGKITLY